MRKQMLASVIVIVTLCFAASAAVAIPLPRDLSGYYKFGYTDGNTYAVRVEMGVGSIRAYVLPGDDNLYLGIIIGEEIYFHDKQSPGSWGVLTQIDADTSLITGHNADEGVTNEFTVIRITEEKANEIAERTKAKQDNQICVNNLKQLGLILNIFARDNNNEFPYSLSETYPDYATYKGIFVCPAHGGGFRDYDDDYEYIPGFRSGDPNPDQEPILIERKGNHNEPPGAYHVLYLDGHVERHTD